MRYTELKSEHGIYFSSLHAVLEINFNYKYKENKAILFDPIELDYKRFSRLYLIPHLFPRSRMKRATWLLLPYNNNKEKM